MIDHARDELLATLAPTPLGPIVLGADARKRATLLDDTLGTLRRYEALGASIEAGQDVHPIGDTGASTALGWVMWDEMAPFWSTDEVYHAAALLGMPILDYLHNYVLLETAGLVSIRDDGIHKLPLPAGIAPPPSLIPPALSRHTPRNSRGGGRRLQ